MRRFRGRRFAQFCQRIAPRSQDRLLDVGGYASSWTPYEPVVKDITCLNVHEVAWDGSSHPDHGIQMIVGDGRSLAFQDRSFEILFSNSVIEHVGAWEDQQDFAREARRVGEALWVQTPAYECPIEPHYVAPFIHWLPKPWRIALIRWVTLWGWAHRPTREEVLHEVNTIRLLKRKEMDELFPDCEILTERLLGIFPKSYIAVRKRCA